MAAGLGTIVSTLVGMGQTVLWAIVTACNLVLAAVGVAFAAALGLLPSMDDAPSIGSPSWLGWANWFFPIGDFLSLLTGGVALWMSFLVVRYVLRLVRAI